VGENMKIGYNVLIDEDTTIKQKDCFIVGDNVAIDKGFYCTTKFQIGNFIHIGPYVTCIGGKNSEFYANGFNNIMAGARIICASDRFDDTGLFGAMIPLKYKGTQIIKPVIMEKYSNIGTNAIVLPGSILRQGVLLCAGSLLVGDTEEWGVYKGNPAKLIKKINKETIIKKAEQLTYELQCSN
jgi:acetyltransferase-like isoleucine patch superfamily enzyme